MIREIVTILSHRNFHTQENTSKTTAETGTAYTNACQLYSSSGARMRNNTNATTAISHTRSAEHAMITVRRKRRMFLGISFLSRCSCTRSSRETPNSSAICMRMRTSGIPFPCSHLETDLSE